MVLTGQAQAGDIILEIGPGKGALTKTLLESGATVVAIEKDPELIEYLHNAFEKEHTSGQLYIHEGDALDFESDAALQKILIILTDTYTKPFKIIANIPYYITGALLRTYLTSTHKPSEMVLLIQKEVAQRITHKDGKSSLLSLSIGLYGTATYIKKVPPKSFSPAPAVDSAIIHITDIKQPQDIPRGREDEFFTLLHRAFAHKRKTCIKNLSAYYDRDALDRVYTELNLDTRIRAEDIDLSTWIRFFKKI